MDCDQRTTVIDIRTRTLQRAAIERRLDDGYVRIEQAIANGEDVAAWEDFWFSLLADYEALSAELSTAA